MQIVEKKILPKYFQDILYNNKRFELRKDENTIEVGDILLLKEWNGKEYTGNRIETKVVYVLRDCEEYGLQKGFCIIGFEIEDFNC